MREWTTIAAGLLLGASSLMAAGTGTAAQAQAAPEAALHTNARPLYRNPPDYPRRAIQRRQEGWVDVSFVVERDGSVSDPVVESSSGVTELEQAALDAVLTWQYRPATRNGQPVQQCEVRSRLTFSIETGRPSRASSKFRRRHRAIEKLVDRHELVPALAATRDLLATTALNQYETARAWALYAIIEQKMGAAPPQRLDALRRATASSHMIGGPMHRSLLENLLDVELQLRHYHRAIEVAGRLRGEVPEEARREELAGIIAELFAFRDSDSYLAVSGQIETMAVSPDHVPFWTHQPLRRQFGIEDVNGRISGIDVRCQWHRALLTHDPQLAVRLADDWGDCDVYIYGEPGTTFTLVEYPLT
jgi:TonB family protein